MARATTNRIAKAVGLGAVSLVLNGPLWAADTTLPSGHKVALAEVIWGTPGPAGHTVRFRFVDGELAARVSNDGFVDAEADMAHLCSEIAVPQIKDFGGAAPDQVIISISDRFLPLGDADPEAVQLFEAYRVENDGCVWEGF
ncbi:MAG: DUF6497 family protein [Maritimibacter sp.]